MWRKLDQIQSYSNVLRWSTLHDFIVVGYRLYVKDYDIVLILAEAVFYEWRQNENLIRKFDGNK